MNVLEHTMLGIDRILNGSPSSSDGQHGRKSALSGAQHELSEGDSQAGSGTAGAGISYPVTCRARYYDAASRILEDELHLFTHANADELGLVIEQWIEKKRENWEPAVMSKAQAIKDLRRALRMGGLPQPKNQAAVYERDENGEIVAASVHFCVGYMSGAIKDALAELGAKDI